MSRSKTEHGVIATFDSSAQAQQAANDLMDWDRTNPNISLGVGIGALAAVLSGGLTLIPTAIGGAVVGGAAGALSHKGLGLTDAERQQLNTELDGGRAALLVMCSDADVKAITDYLTLEGGRTMSLQVESGGVESAAADRT